VETRSFWDRIDKPTKVVGACVAIGVAVITTYLAVAGNPFAPSASDSLARSEPAAVAARQTQRCLVAHKMHSPRVTVGSTIRRLRFRRCDWPPITDTSTDGYSEIVDFIRPIPGLKNAALFDEVDRYTAPCDAINVTYVLAQTGSREFVSRRLARGRLYVATTIAVGKYRYRLVLRQLNEIPGAAVTYIPNPSNAREFFVLHSGHFQPFDATCVNHG
jgi:hypothetical protein